VGAGKASASFLRRNGGESIAAGVPHDPKQGRSGRATPNRRSPPGCRLVRRPASGSREMARRKIEQSAPRPRSVLNPNTRRRRCSKLEREGRRGKPWPLVGGSRRRVRSVPHGGGLAAGIEGASGDHAPFSGVTRGCCLQTSGNCQKKPARRWPGSRSRFRFSGRRLLWCSRQAASGVSRRQELSYSASYKFVPRLGGFPLAGCWA
jgi:hypothetical protein